MSPDVPSVRRPAELPEGVSQATIGVRGGLLRSGFEETAEAMYLTSGYVYSTAAKAEKAFTGDIDRYVYSRYGNPTISMFEERLRLIEGAPACFATATGMAAVFTSLGALLAAGDRLVAARSLFGSCFVVCSEILPRWGVETVFVDGDDLSQWEEALSVPTQAVFFETPSNPMQQLVDIAAVCEMSHAAGQKWCWTTCLPHLSCSRACRLVPMSWCIRVPSTSTGRAECSVVRSSVTSSTSTSPCRS